MLNFVSLIFLGVLVWPSDLIIIKSPQITNIGRWYDMEYCPDNMYAVSMQLKIQNYQGSNDDTGLNGVALYCQPLNLCK